MSEMSVYQAICGVQADLAKQGITKDQENTFDHYKFRGIDDIYNALAPLLAKHQLCILPRMLSRTCDERQSRQGGALFYVTVDAEFDFVSAQDTSIATVRVFGEAMDRGDKATNKAMSAAYKYACFQTFCIPTEGDNDADATTPDPKAKPPAKPPESKPKSKTPIEEYLDSMKKAKAVLHGMTGSDEVYYSALKYFDIQHANEMKDMAKGEQLLNQLRTFVKERKNGGGNAKDAATSETPRDVGKEFPPSS